MHFAAECHQYKQVHGESASTSGYHSANADVSEIEDEMAESTIGATPTLAKTPLSDCTVIAVLTEANSRLVK
jgi:hypothetical protein